MQDFIMVAAALATIAGFLLTFRDSPKTGGKTGRVKVSGHSTFKKFMDKIVTTYADLVLTGSVAFIAGAVFDGVLIWLMLAVIVLYRLTNKRWKWFPPFAATIVAGSMGYALSQHYQNVI